MKRAKNVIAIVAVLGLGMLNFTKSDRIMLYRAEASTSGDSFLSSIWSSITSFLSSTFDPDVALGQKMADVPCPGSTSVTTKEKTEAGAEAKGDSEGVSVGVGVRHETETKTETTITSYGKECKSANRTDRCDRRDQVFCADVKK